MSKRSRYFAGRSLAHSHSNARCWKLIALLSVTASATGCSAPVARRATDLNALMAMVGSEPHDTGWFCPMHPDVTATTAGICGKCGMQLLAGHPFDTREYALEIETLPRAIEPKMPTLLRLTVLEPDGGSPVTAYENVHDKEFHLFLISQDLTVFQHLHPTFMGGGVWEIEVTFPKAGYYQVVSDFVPKGGSPQFLSRSISTSNYEGDILADAASPEVDIDAIKTVDGITAAVRLEPQPLVAGQFGHLLYTFEDSQTGVPIRDLEPYLGAFGHTLIMSADLRDAVHSHPSLEPGSDVAQGKGGPNLTFEGYLPQPGLYRAWTQVQRNDHVVTFEYTFEVLSLDDAFPIGVLAKAQPFRVATYASVCPAQ